MQSPSCPKCQGSMSHNPKKVPGANPKLPDWICDQANGACGSTVVKDGKTYQNKTGAWNPKEVVATPAESQTIAQVQYEEKQNATGERMNRSNLAGQFLASGQVLDDAAWKKLFALEYWAKTGERHE